MSQEEIPKSFPADVRIHKGESDIAKDWEDYINKEDDADAYFDAFNDRFKKLGIDIKKSKVLEIGCGKGIFLNYLKKQGVDVVGGDSRPRGETKGLPIIAARIEQLPFPNETFDIVLGTAVFDAQVYDQNHRLMMQEISRVLKHRGVYAMMRNRLNESVDDLVLIPNPNERIFKNVEIFRKS